MSLIARLNNTLICELFYLGVSAYNVDLMVPPQNVIHTLSNSSSLLLKNHCGLWLREMANLKKQCAVTGIAAYTDRVVGRFSTDAMDKWLLKPKFYAVPRFNTTSSLSFVIIRSSCFNSYIYTI